MFRGNAEAVIRENLVRRGYLKGIIGLPPNLFYGTGIPACILVVDKRESAGRRGIFMVDASTGFIKDGAKNRLRSQDIHKIVDVFNNQIDTPVYARMVGFDEIEKNEFNLNLPRYIDSSEKEDLQDISAHLIGGIPVRDIDDLQDYWDVCPTLRQHLFTDNRPGYVDLAVEKSEIKPAIFEHPEFVGFAKGMNDHFDAWRTRHAAELRELTAGFNPKDLIDQLSEDLLSHYRGKPLIDAYDIYQHLMDYWTDTMQDDAYLIAADGWIAETSRIIERQKNGKEKDKGWTCDLIPKPLIVARYFADEQAAIDQLNAQLDAKEAEQAELEEEHGGEEDAFGSMDKINKSTVTARIKELADGDEADEELTVLKKWQTVSTAIAKLKKQIKTSENDLDTLAHDQYSILGESEIKTLLVDDKWMAVLATKIQAETNQVSNSLTTRVKDLADRYDTPIALLDARVEEIQSKVKNHLCKMGFESEVSQVMA